MKYSKDNIKIHDAKKAFDAFDLVRKRPKMFLSNLTISSLQNFINGYNLANPYSDDDPPFWNFPNFLISETNYKNDRKGKTNLISRILLQECEGDEIKAYHKFFEYLEIYKSKKTLPNNK